MRDFMKVLVKEFKKESPNVILEQVFSGHIVDIEGEVAYVHLFDETHGDEELTAEMQLSAFPKDPLYPQLSSGVIFYWYIGYEGDKENDENWFSTIRLSQAVWTQEMIDNANAEAEKLVSLFKEAKIAD